MDKTSVKITIPIDLLFVQLIINNASEIARIMKFPDNEIHKIELGVEEAVTDIIKNAFEGDDEQTLDVTFNIKPLGLEIVIHEKGIPFDPSIIPEFSPEKFKQDYSDKGLGMYLMKKFMDEFSFHNLGKEGKETRLFKHLGYKAIQNILENNELKNIEKEKKLEPLPKGSVKYNVRRIKSDEAVEVSKCAYSSYGYTYVNEDVYYPDRVRKLNKNGDLISFVAVKEDGEIIAHAALERERDRQVPQLGIAATKPRYRGQGCMNALNTLMIEEAEKRKFMGIYARGITTHFYSQKSIEKYGLKPSALLISSGLERKYKEIEQKKIQRESVVILFKYLNYPKGLKIYPPKKHRDFIINLYNNISGKPEVLTSKPDMNLPSIPGKITVNTQPSSLTSDIFVYQYGNNTLHEIQKTLTKLCLDRIETIYLYLPLSLPHTAQLAPEFEEMGFFIAGIKPGSDHSDTIIFQYLNNFVIDYDLLKFSSDESKEIMKWVRKNDPNYNIEK